MRGDLEWKTIPRMLEVNAERFPDREVLVDGDSRLTFPQLHAEMIRAARGVAALGVEPGERVGIWAPNSGAWVIAALGALAAGCIVVPVNTRFKGEEAAFALSKSGTTALFTVTDFLDSDYVTMLRKAAPEAEALSRTIVMSGEPLPGTTGWEDFIGAGEAVSETEAQSRIGALSSDQPSDIMFTSGTTGHPKGVIITHGQSLRAYRSFNEVIGLREGDRYLILNPFFHCFGYKAGWMSCIMQGATIVPYAVFDIPALLQRVQDERITVLPGPPTLLQGVLDHPQRGSYDLSSLRLMITGAAVVPAELVQRLKAQMGIEAVLTGYALTESSGIVSMSRLEDDPEDIARTAGRPLEDIEVKVVDDGGTEVPVGSPGEILVRGYNVMQGYYDEPEETAKVIEPDGWLHTGDIGVVDGQGNVTITDRKKDMFIVGGFNAYPAEIERILLGNAKLAQAAVVGMPDDRLGEVGAAFVVPRPGEVITPEEVMSWARERMANFKVPRSVEILDSLPMNASMKVVKSELRQRAANIAVAGQ